MGNELTADPYNPGGLNPRGTAWEADARLVQRIGGVDLNLGAFFRCRHEVDGLDQADHRVGQASTTFLSPAGRGNLGATGNGLRLETGVRLASGTFY